MDAWHGRARAVESTLPWRSSRGAKSVRASRIGITKWREKQPHAPASASRAQKRYRSPGRAPKVHSAAACSCEPQWLHSAPFGPAQCFAMWPNPPHLRHARVGHVRPRWPTRPHTLHGPTVEPASGSGAAAGGGLSLRLRFLPGGAAGGVEDGSASGRCVSATGRCGSATAAPAAGGSRSAAPAPAPAAACCSASSLARLSCRAFVEPMSAVDESVGVRAERGEASSKEVFLRSVPPPLLSVYPAPRRPRRSSPSSPTGVKRMSAPSRRPFPLNRTLSLFPHSSSPFSRTLSGSTRACDGPAGCPQGPLGRCGFWSYA